MKLRGDASKDASLEYLHAQLAGAGDFVFYKLSKGGRRALSRGPRHACTAVEMFIAENVLLISFELISLLLSLAYDIRA